MVGVFCGNWGSGVYERQLLGFCVTWRLRCGGRQLPQSRACGASQHAADTAAAKAEGVARGVAGILSVAGNLLVRGSRRFSRNTAVTLRRKATPSGAAAPAPSRGSLGVVLSG